MKLVTQHKTSRFQLLLALYIASDADCDFSVNMEQLAEKRNMDYKKFTKSLQYLIDENFVALEDGGGESQAVITHKGIKVLEEVFLDAKKQTYYFPSYRDMREKSC